MNPSDRLDLKKLMKAGEHDYVDNTDGIRRLKHSDLIASDMKTMEGLKLDYADMRETYPDNFSRMCQKKCSFLFNAYTDIYNRLYKDQLDMNLMFDALRTLKDVETGKINQQEGSILMGKLFYKVFVSNAIKHEDSVVTPVVEGGIQKDPEVKLTWIEYKRTVLKKLDTLCEKEIAKPAQKTKQKGKKKK